MIKNEWECMRFDKQLKWIEQAEFLKDRGFFQNLSTDELAKKIYEAKNRC